MVGLRYEFVDVTDDNVCETGLFCQKSKYKEKGYQDKLSWFKEQYKKGLRTKLVGFQNDKERFVLVGFIEYAPGEHAWRGVDAKGWMVIHCLWIIGKHQGQGLGSKLLEECAKDAKKNGLNGTVAMASRTHWLANEKLSSKMVLRNWTKCHLSGSTQENSRTMLHRRSSIPFP